VAATIRGQHAQDWSRQYNSSPTALSVAKAWWLGQALLSALDHSQAFLIFLGAQRQAGRRRDKHWAGTAWQVLHVLDVPYPPSKNNLSPDKNALKRASCMLHFALARARWRSITASQRPRSMLIYHHRLLPARLSRVRRIIECARAILQHTAELLISVRPIESS
jgi:hypothetical protein